jgi:hypothetical protein
LHRFRRSPLNILGAQKQLKMGTFFAPFLGHFFTRSRGAPHITFSPGVGGPLTFQCSRERPFWGKSAQKCCSR